MNHIGDIPSTLPRVEQDLGSDSGPPSFSNAGIATRSGPPQTSLDQVARSDLSRTLSTGIYSNQPTEQVNMVSQDAMEVQVLDDKPKRPLSAYNLFFQDQRRKILESRPVRAQGKPRRSHGKMGFADMARTVASRWNNLDAGERAVFESLARQEKMKYKKALAAWKKKSVCVKKTTTLDKGTADPTQTLENAKATGEPAAGSPQSQSIAMQAEVITLQETPLLPDEQLRLQRNLSRLATVMQDQCVSDFIGLFRQDDAGC